LRESSSYWRMRNFVVKVCVIAIDFIRNAHQVNFVVQARRKKKGGK